MHSNRLSSLFCALLVGITAPAAAQSTGFELALDALPQARYGETVHLNGVVFDVSGYADLRGLSNGQVTARLRQVRIQGRNRSVVTVQEVTVDTQSGGQFSVDIPVPERPLLQPSLQIEFGRGSSHRTLDYSLNISAPDTFDLLTDRQRYEPGETIQVWARLRRFSNGRPVEGRQVRAQVFDAQGRPLLETEAPTTAGGVVHIEAALPEGAVDGAYRIVLNTIGGVATASAQRNVTVARRTVERLMVSVNIDQVVVRPSARVTGTVRVLTPSGTAVEGAAVTLQSGDDTTQLTTGADGTAAIRLQAPAYLPSDILTQQVVATARHPAHGALSASGSYLVSRVPWKVEARAENGALVPETDGLVYIAVSDPRGGPAPAGTEIEVRGNVVRGGSHSATVTEHGLAEVPVRVADGVATVVREAGSTCAGQYAVPVTIEVLGEQPVVARSCVRVAPEARVSVHASSSAVEPGGTVRVDLARHPEVRGRSVIVEALVGARPVAAAFTTGSNISLTMPGHLAGLVTLRARPVMPASANHPLDQPGGVTFGTGSSTAVVVRPSDAFGMRIESQRRWRVREQATLDFQTTQASPQAFVAYVTRDLAAHGGEQPWTLTWMQSAFGDALTTPGDDGELFLRASMAATVQPDPEASRPPPLVPPLWETARGYGGPRHGQLRDPVAMRDNLLRRTVGQLEIALERIVEASIDDEDAMRGIVEGTGANRRFAQNALAHLVEARRLPRHLASTLGGEIATMSMIRGADPSFSFDRVAKRISRKRLMYLMAAVSAFSNPDNASAARVSTGYAPERWLSRMVQLRVISPNSVRDAWGRSFTLRTANNPRYVLSARAPRHELASPGPDGRFGTADDLSNPFSRVVPQGTPYSVASGEDALMLQLSVLSTGPMTLQAMNQAYRAMSLATLDESRASTIRSLASEGGEAWADELNEDGSDAGYGRGGGGDMDDMLGAALGGVRTRRPAPARSAAAPAAEAAMMEAEYRPEEAQAQQMPRDSERNQRAENDRSAFANMAAVVREDFPATLNFVPMMPLDGTSTRATLPLADALTTYRIEAIAWTSSGWTTTATTELEVDQDATVDSPTPPFATVGDTLQLPVRIANRTTEPLEVRLSLHAEGLQLNTGEGQTVTVPPRDASEVIVPLRPTTPGEGTLRVQIERTNGDPLDAVRRPLRVWPDARTVREMRELLVVPGEQLRFAVPEQATPRGPGAVRVAPGSMLFGDPSEYSAGVQAGWVLAFSGAEISDDQVLAARGALRADQPNEDLRIGGQPAQIAQAISVLWNQSSVDEMVIRRGLRHISSVLPGPEARGAGVAQLCASILIGLAPAFRSDGAAGRTSAQSILVDVVNQLKRSAGDSAVQLDSAPEPWSRVAFALASTGSTARARELLRRAARHVIDLGDESFLEPTGGYGQTIARVDPTASMAAALVLLGNRSRALEFIRSLVSVRRTITSWPQEGRLIASAAAALLAGGRPTTVRVSVDGTQVELVEQNGIWIGDSEALGRPGSHRVLVEAGDAPALAYIDARYGLPWDAPLTRRARVDIELDGESGPRDTRAGLALTLRNREPRMMSAPMLEVDLPAGTELDEPTRESLRALAAGEPTMEGRTLRVPLRPLAPGGFVRLPLPLRWSVGGALRGLGVTLYDDAATPESRGVSVAGSRTIDVANHGEAVEPAEADSSPSPPEPEPDPPPMPFEQLDPVAALMLPAMEAFS